MDKRKKYILVFDTETAPIKKSTVCDSSNSLVYDFGCGIYDKKGNCYENRSYVNKDIFLGEFEKMQSAYYCKKIPNYIEDLANGSRVLRTMEEIKQEVAELIKKYNISTVSAHNARFDLGALATTMEWLSNGEEWFFFPKDRDIEVWDTLGMARDVIAKQPTYKSFCQKNDQMTSNGRVRLTAESIYQFITDNPNFKEEHTGLEDVQIESQILAYCLRQHKAMPRRTLTVFEKSVYPTEWTEKNILDFFEKMLDI